MNNEINTNNNDNNLNTYQITKSIENNKFLKILLSKRNETWKKELFEKLELEDGRATFDDKSLTIKKSNSYTILTEREWCKKIDRTITEFFREFHLESIDFDQSSLNEINQLKSKIEEIRKIYLIDYYQASNSRLFLLGRKPHVVDFFDRFPKLKVLSKLIEEDNQNFSKSNSSKDENDNEDMINKSFELPFNLNDQTIKFFINQILNKLKLN